MMDSGMGMMGGYGPGNGMMGGMMGPGMMGSGMGMGSGMMGGCGMGMMGVGPLSMLDLSDEQRTKIDQILDAQRKQQRALMLKMFDEQDKLRELYSAETPDPKKVASAYGGIGTIQQQMIESHVQANNDMQAVLTKEQREQLRTWRWGGPAGGGMMGR
jgi:Spy/CpxP family protein refolding chaperone